MAICCSEKRENGRMCIFVNVFLTIFSPNTSPVLFFRTGEVGERTGKEMDQQKSMYGVRDGLGQQLPVVSGIEAHL